MKLFQCVLLMLFLIMNEKTLSQRTLSLLEQSQDFEIFKGALKEGHAGLYNFITESAFKKECDSIQITFKDGLSVEDFYLKLRYIIASLHHGHTRISLPTNGNINYKMGVLDSAKLYLPFQFMIIKDKLVVLEDCSKEQSIAKYSVIKSINQIPASRLIKNMLPYMPADGLNETYKIYCLYNYFYFHYLFSLFNPNDKAVEIELENNKTHFYIELLKPKIIDGVYLNKNGKSISQYGKQLEYISDVSQHTAYLRVTSFYKGLIEQFGQSYERYLDSSFANIRRNGIQNLILDIRDNEGGGDNYENILFSYLNEERFTSNTVVRVAGTKFQYKKYADNSSGDVKTFLENPAEFLQDDSSLLLKKEYSEQMTLSPNSHLFVGNVYIIMNGGTFSAGSNFIKLMNNRRNRSPERIIRFIGEENGGDIYAQAECAGQSYIVTLPNSKTNVDMPFLCFGDLKKKYPDKLLPDYSVYPTINNLKNGKDDEVLFIINNKKKIDKPLVQTVRQVK